MNKYLAVIAVNFLIKSKGGFLFQSHSIRHSEDIEVVFSLHQNYILLVGAPHKDPEPTF